MPKFSQQPTNAPPVAGPVRQSGSVVPNTLYCRIPNLKISAAEMLAKQACAQARTLSPKLSGRAAEGIKPYFGEGYFGVRWDRPYLWYQEAGIGAFTMRNLAGKTIPMWVDDWTGEMARANPKAKTRITSNGRRQILIFRKAGKIGARKRVAQRDARGRLLRWRDVPQSYPGAPGRIQVREWQPPDRTTGRITSTGTRIHVGVRWRHPGLVPREFMQYSIQSVADLVGYPNIQVYAIYGRS